MRRLWLQYPETISSGRKWMNCGILESISLQKIETRWLFSLWFVRLPTSSMTTSRNYTKCLRPDRNILRKQSNGIQMSLFLSWISSKRWTAGKGTKRCFITCWWSSGCWTVLLAIESTSDRSRSVNGNRDWSGNRSDSMSDGCRPIHLSCGTASRSISSKFCRWTKSIKCYYLFRSVCPPLGLLIFEIIRHWIPWNILLFAQ